MSLQLSSSIKNMSDSMSHIGIDTSFAAKQLEEGNLVAIPTETVYGLACDASSSIALDKLYKAKGRPTNHPVIVHIPDSSHLEDWVISPSKYAPILAKKFWPGPLTLVLKRKSSVLDQITGGQETVAIRIPDHPLTLELLNKFGKAIAAPSANKFGRLSPTSASDVANEFADELAYILEGGNCSVGIESTILDLSQNNPRILRPGKITRASLEEVLATKVDCQFENNQNEQKNKIRVPGALPSHYAPVKPLYLVDGNNLESVLTRLKTEKKKAATLSFRELNDTSCKELSLVSKLDQSDYAKNLYASLRKLDSMDCDMIIVETPPKTADWTAINDRLNRASKGTI